jgi:hypothetical protein
MIIETITDIVLTIAAACIALGIFWAFGMLFFVL